MNLSFFRKSSDAGQLNFSSRAEAFAYMLRLQLEKRVEPMEAAEKANAFADIFASNMGLPVSVEPPAEGVDRYLQHIDKVVCYLDQHPKAVDMVVGVATFLLGAFAGKSAEQAAESAAPTPPREPIDFDSLD
jgi:hypothetical protein